jgi:hypothetical protein
MINHDYLHIINLVKYSLSISPNNKKSCLNLDNNNNHSGYIQWSIIQDLDDLHIQKSPNGKKSSIVKLYDVKNNLTCKERNEALKQIHFQGQKYIGNIVDTLSKIIQACPNAYQAQIIRYAGLDVEKDNHTNKTGMTILDLMNSQGIIKKYKDGSNTKYQYLGGLYKPIPYIPPNKNASKLEALLANYLLENNYDFDQQVTFKDLKYKKQLRIDFKVKINDNDYLYIEVNGRQHYEYIPYFHKNGEVDFQDQQNRDKEKYRYMKANELPFLIIKYDSNIIETFENYIKKF